MLCFLVLRAMVNTAEEERHIARWLVRLIVLYPILVVVSLVMLGFLWGLSLVTYLEGAFWICDYRATARGAANGGIAVCTAVYEAVKARKFGGDFDKLLEWWREHKTARHDVLATLEGAPARR